MDEKRYLHQDSLSTSASTRRVEAEMESWRCPLISTPALQHACPSHTINVIF